MFQNIESKYKLLLVSEYKWLKTIMHCFLINNKIAVANCYSVRGIKVMEYAVKGKIINNGVV